MRFLPRWSWNWEPRSDNSGNLQVTCHITWTDTSTSMYCQVIEACGEKNQTVLFSYTHPLITIYKTSYTFLSDYYTLNGRVRLTHKSGIHQYNNSEILYWSQGEIVFVPIPPCKIIKYKLLRFKKYLKYVQYVHSVYWVFIISMDMSDIAGIVISVKTLLCHNLRECVCVCVSASAHLLLIDDVGSCLRIIPVTLTLMSWLCASHPVSCCVSGLNMCLINSREPNKHKVNVSPVCVLITRDQCLLLKCKVSSGQRSEEETDSDRDLSVCPDPGASVI